MEERRGGDRHQPSPDVQAVFRYRFGKKQLTARASRILDISDGGCCAKYKSKDIVNFKTGQTGKLKLQLDSKSLSEELDAKIKRVWEDGAAVSFKTPTTAKRYYKKETPEENFSGEKVDGTVAGSNKKSTTQSQALAFAQMDYDLVHREIIDIKSCRSNIFVGTLGILGAIGTAILSIIGLSPPQTKQEFFFGMYRITLPIQSSCPKWLFSACLIPVVLLICSIFATIHKAKNLNMRVSYLEVLSEYLANGKTSECWVGWLKAKQVFDRCKIYMKNNEEKISSCEIRKYYLQKQDSRLSSKLSCGVEGKKKSLEITKKISTFTTPLNSFTSLTTYIYGSFLIISSGILLFVLMNITKGSIDEDGFNSTRYWRIVALGVIVTLSLYSLKTYLPKKESTRRMKKWAQRFYGAYCIFCGIAVPSFLLIWFCKQNWGVSYYPIMIAYTLGVAISIGIVILVCYFYNQIRSLRKGKFSQERLRHVWKLCFEYCPLMKEETPIEL